MPLQAVKYKLVLLATRRDVWAPMCESAVIRYDQTDYSTVPFYGNKRMNLSGLAWDCVKCVL